jgi:hypothetical protein
MKRSSRPTRTPANLSESVHQRLNMYSLAAGAAGVSVLALAMPSEGKIVYTAAHHILGKNSHYNLDLNHDGKTDFTISNNYACGTDNCWSGLFAKPMNGAQGVEGARTLGGFDWAYALDRGARVGPKHAFSGLYLLIAGRGSCWPGDSRWCNVTNQYLGLSFKIHGQTHYGWARLSVYNQIRQISATLTGYAYETIPNKAIVAGQTKGPDDISVEEPDAALIMPTPEPATLGAFAIGAPGLSIWRREERRPNLDT